MSIESPPFHAADLDAHSARVEDRLVRHGRERLVRVHERDAFAEDDRAQERQRSKHRRKCHSANKWQLRRVVHLAGRADTDRQAP